LPNEFKLFVPQAQKTKKTVGITPNLNKQTKENVSPQPNEEEELQNKSEIPEESLHQDINPDEEHNDEAEEDVQNPDVSANVA